MPVREQLLHLVDLRRSNQICIKAGSTGGIPILGTAVAGNGDELHLPVLRCLAQGPGQLISIDARKSDVHQRGVGRVVMLGGYQTMDFGFTALFDYG